MKISGTDELGNQIPEGADPLHAAKCRAAGLKDGGMRTEALGQPSHPDGADLGKHVQDDGGFGVGHGEEVKGEKVRERLKAVIPFP